MEWIPRGPDFVFQPRDTSYTRLSLYNEVGLQGRVVSIVIDPSNQHVIYALERPHETKGITIFRKRADSLKWDPITDSLRDIDPSRDPSCIAVNPVNPNVIYVGTYHNSRVYRGEISTDANGRANVTWGSGSLVGSGIHKILVDSRHANQLGTYSTRLFAACRSGVYYSENDGRVWSRILNADITSIIGYFPTTDWAISHVYAGCYKKGVYYTDRIYNDLEPNPDNQTATRRWIQLSTGGNMLPRFATSTAEPGGNFDIILMERTELNPNRIYIWLLKEVMGGHATAGLYTTEAARNNWMQVGNDSTMLPQPFQNFFNAVFAVAPNSPGNGNQDILFFGGLTIQRSLDGGRTWSAGNAGFHPDMHAIAFFPHGTNPADVYIGCDGGIAFSHHFADRSFQVAALPGSTTTFNQSDRINERDGQFRNLNHGKPSSIVFSYSSHPEISALGYIACQDTGISAGSGTSCWRGLLNGDTYQIVVAPGLDGVKLWATTGMYNTIDYGWPNLKLTVLTDKGNFGTSSFFVSLPSNGSNLLVTSNLVESNKKSFSGCHVLESNTNRRLNRSIRNIMNPPRQQNAYPSSMSDIDVGSHLILDERNDNIEEVTVTGTGRDSGPNGRPWFRALFKKPHNSGASVKLMKSVVVSVDINSSGPPSVTQLGREFGLISNPNPNIRTVDRIGISQNPAYWDKICCATVDKKLWVYDSGTDSWNEIQTPNSFAKFIDINSIAISGDGDIYWLLKNPIPLNTSNGSITTSLFKFIQYRDSDPLLGQWEPQFMQFTTPLPAGYEYQKLVSHPQRPDILFLSYGMKILKLTRSSNIGLGNPPTGGWQCEDISLNLPKQYVNDLWIGEIKHSERRNVLLRAILSTRALWEVDVSQSGTGSNQPMLYMRDNILDHGWLNRSPPLSNSVTERVPNPYAPEMGLYLWHYQSPDIKIDLQEYTGDLGGVYYQTDPEAPLPFYQRDPGSPYSVRSPPEISYDMFEQIKDKSQNLIELSEAWVHVQVHNHSNLEANDVYVWAIFCNAAAGVPSLNARTGMPANNSFNFWNEVFRNPQGRISHNNLPSNSRWRSIGDPRRLSGIKADHPKVASWKWRIPQLSSENRGHYCIMAFIQNRSDPIRETHTDPNAIVRRNSQITQKNLHIISVRR